MICPDCDSHDYLGGKCHACGFDPVKRLGELAGEMTVEEYFHRCGLDYVPEQPNPGDKKMPTLTTLELPDAGVAVVHKLLKKAIAQTGTGVTDRIAMRDVLADLERLTPDSLRGELQLDLPAAEPDSRYSGPLVTRQQIIEMRQRLGDLNLVDVDLLATIGQSGVRSLEALAAEFFAPACEALTRKEEGFGPADRRLPTKES